MCGIVGFTGHKQAAPILLAGLKKLEYRGYDSAGIAVRDGEELAQVVKATGKLKNLSEKTDGGNSLKGTCGNEAYCFYRPLPLRSLTLKDLIRYMTDSVDTWDIASFIIASLMVTLVGMILPKLNHILMGEVVTYGSMQLLGAVMSFMLFAMISSFMLSIIKQFVQSRIRTKLSVNVQAAAMMRVLSLPAAFFKSYSSGELSQYLAYVNSLCTTLVDSIFSTAITGIFSLVYLTQIFSYAKSLVIPSLVVSVLTLGLSIAGNMAQSQINKELMELSAQERGLE